METQREHVGKLVYDTLCKIIGRREGVEINYKITYLEPESNMESTTSDSGQPNKTA